MDDLPDPVRAGERHLRDLSRGHALRGQQDHLGTSPGHHRPGASPHDPQQPLPLVIIDLANLHPLGHARQSDAVTPTAHRFSPARRRLQGER